MSLFESARIAWRALLSNKLRSSLAILGIIFGVASVIAIMSLGSTFKGTITGEVNKMGAGVLFVNSGDGSLTSGIPMNLMTAEDEQAINAALPVEKSGLMVQTSTPILVDGQPKFVATVGSNHHFEDLRNWQVADGRFFTKEELDAREKVAVIGESTRDLLFGKGGDWQGKSFKFKDDEVRVVGVLEKYTLSMGGADLNNVIILPLTYLSDKTGDKNATMLMVRFKDPQDAERYKAKVEEIVKEKHGVKDFTVQNQQELLSAFNTILDNVTLFIGGVAAIALLVGGIGIMNIMLVSVKERTREIGVRKAIGARRGDILAQFLVEAVTLTLLGGGLGILFGLGMAAAGAAGLGWEFVPSLPAIGLGFGFSTAVGIFFGFYPAYSASRLPAVEALRYE